MKRIYAGREYGELVSKLSHEALPVLKVEQNARDRDQLESSRVEGITMGGVYDCGVYDSAVDGLGPTAAETLAVAALRFELARLVVVVRKVGFEKGRK